MNNFSILISTCDSYSDTWEPLLHQLSKHWSIPNIPIYLMSETKTTSYGSLDIRCLNMKTRRKRYTWSEMTLSALDRIDSEFVLLMLDDFWLTKDVDSNRFDKYLSFMQNSPDTGYICLRDEIEKMQFCGNLATANTLECEMPDIIECDKHMPFRITTQAGIWRKEFLQHILRPHESIWEFESRGTWRSQFSKKRVFCVKETLFYYPHGGVLNGGRIVSDFEHLFDSSLIKPIIQRRGTIKENEIKKKEPPKTPKYYYRKLLSALPKL